MAANEQSQRPELPVNVGDTRDFNGTRYLIVDEVTHVQLDNPDRVLYLQKLRDPYGRIEYRLGYYKLQDNDTWHWANNTTMCPEGDFRRILRAAKDRGWPL